ncbi:biliverdin-producing heme oxygenase [Telluribacter sp.]|jgi:heme oxygenase|uniref:biliverdin-producing heme oxygenase n=1 Tax=Telluribacter sp. TaxID=1978767 RepID=UPI002E137AD7|nr:biliverdin-producing heme oxygenase [Telluribacter sp.]
MNPLHAQLKSATATLHDKTEKALFVEAIVSHQLSREQLTTILLAQYQFNWALEQAVQSIEVLRQEYQAHHRYKTDLLRADLAELGTPLPDEAPAWDIFSEAELFGACYVAEGSTLGGKIIRKHLTQSAQLNGLSFHYYSVYGTDVGPQWKLFLTFLDYHSQRLLPAEVVLGAQKSFHFLLQAVQEVRV